MVTAAMEGMILTLALVILARCITIFLLGRKAGDLIAHTLVKLILQIISATFLVGMKGACCLFQCVYRMLVTLWSRKEKIGERVRLTIKRLVDLIRR